ncbi:MAG TPA: prephenate dehydratase [Spirochaetota bacterium]|nr:prephenate dehydratase [Spirochaetota bacterium]
MSDEQQTLGTLEGLRSKIDEVDRGIAALLEERMDLALQIGQVKAREGLPVYHPEREHSVISRIVEHFHAGHFPLDSAKRIYTEIVGACRDAQRALRVAYLGPHATYSHMALERRFGGSALAIPQETIADVFSAVISQNADCGVVPVENSNEGSVAHTLDLLAEGRVHVIGEVLQPVHHCLLSTQTTLDRIRRVLAHPQALAQCRRWISRNLPHATVVETSSNGKAAEIAASEDGSAAIAARIAARLYRLNLLAESIEDNADNITRFFIIGAKPTMPTGKDRTSLVIAVKDRPGILHDLLDVFARRGINMSRIESRPSRIKAWEYVFFVDVDGHAQVSPLSDALSELDAHVRTLRVIGSYPRSED